MRELVSASLQFRTEFDLAPMVRLKAHARDAPMTGTSVARFVDSVLDCRGELRKATMAYETVEETWDCPKLILHHKDGSQSQASGKVCFDSVGNVWVEAEVLGAHHLTDFAEGQQIIGQTADGMSVEIDGAHTSRVTLTTDSEHTAVTWMPMECRVFDPALPKVTRSEVLFQDVRIFGRSQFQHSGAQCTLEPIHHKDDDRRGLIRARLTGPSTFDHRPIAALLSLAQRCPIGAPMIKSYSSDRLVSTTLRPSGSKYKAYNQLIPRDGNKLAAFLNSCLPAFQAKATDYELRRLIEYYALSIQQPVAELKFILASVFMEAFKFYWAKNVAKKQQDLKANGLIRGFVKSVGSNGKPVNYGFEDLLTEACVSLGYSTTFTFLDERNAMFHSGAPGGHQLGQPSTWAAIQLQLTPLYRQIDDILLRVLGYSGPVLRWDTPNTEEQFP